MDTKTFISKAQDYGYTATCTPEGEIDYLYPADQNSLTIEIFLPYTLSGERKPAEIQTTSWGSKSPEEIAEVIKAYENALAMVETINEYQATR